MIWRALFPPSPDGGFIEGGAGLARPRDRRGRFPPSPDGGFIEGTAVLQRAAAASAGFHHLQMVASLRDQVESDTEDMGARCFHHLQMVASLRDP